ncbi:MAG: hypothetical protein ABJJ53_09365 [Sulfitobacter sp.]
MSATPNAKIISDLKKLIQTEHLDSSQYEPSQMAQYLLILGAKLLETAGYELAQTQEAQHTVPLLALSTHVAQISETL